MTIYEIVFGAIIIALVTWLMVPSKRRGSGGIVGPKPERNYDPFHGASHNPAPLPEGTMINGSLMGYNEYRKKILSSEKSNPVTFGKRAAKPTV